LGKFLEGLGMEKVGIFYDHMEYIVWPFGIFCDHLVYFMTI
jgi:hypothetical protein